MKKIKAFVTLALPAERANPAPPVGPALGQHGINIPQFCKEYNLKTAGQLGSIIPVKITIFEDKSYTFVLKTPPVSSLLLKFLNIKKGSSNSKKEILGTISEKELNQIIEIKLPDLNTKDRKKAEKMIRGTAKNMGINIINKE